MKFAIDQALRLLPAAPTERYPQGAPSAEVLARGTVQLKIYVPQQVDLQQPHSRDELYFVVEGRGVFFDGQQRHVFGPGDCLFAAAASKHRFEEFTPDFKTWVVFYGAEGGEQA